MCPGRCLQIFQTSDYNNSCFQPDTPQRAGLIFLHPGHKPQPKKTPPRLGDRAKITTFAYGLPPFRRPGPEREKILPKSDSESALYIFSRKHAPKKEASKKRFTVSLQYVLRHQQARQHAENQLFTSLFFIDMKCRLTRSFKLTCKFAPSDCNEEPGRRNRRGSATRYLEYYY